MVCYRVHIPRGAKVVGVTADGKPATVLPGEYLVHQLPLKIPSSQTLVRLVGADTAGRDVHVPLDAAKKFLSNSANDEVAAESARAA